MRKKTVHLWTQKNKGKTHKIRQHGKQDFSIISFDFFGKKHTYGKGRLKSLKQSKNFLKIYDALPTTKWKKEK